MPKNYLKYKEKVIEDIQQCLNEFECQPILFVGSGISRRYFNGPSWEELLAYMAKQCPKIDKDFAYYKQTYTGLVEIGEVFADLYKEWAWGEGREEFPDELFDANMPSEIYFKYKTVEYFKSLTPSAIDDITDDYLKDEIELLQNIRPHSLITTNYDRFLEIVFPEYQSIIGQQILYTNHESIGEILKIHGCTSEPNSLVITKNDYDEFINKKKYLSAKLLTYFAEHPLCECQIIFYTFRSLRFYT